jgi:hypothetical protein
MASWKEEEKKQKERTRARARTTYANANANRTKKKSETEQQLSTIPPAGRQAGWFWLGRKEGRAVPLTADRDDDDGVRGAMVELDSNGDNSFRLVNQWVARAALPARMHACMAFNGLDPP